MSTLPEAPIWVMDDAEIAAACGPGGRASRMPATPAAAIAGRLGLPFRRLGPSGPEGRVEPGSVPKLILSTGQRAAARAMLHKARRGGLVVHCLQYAPRLPPRWLAAPFDLLVAPLRTASSGDGLLRRGNVLPSLGAAQLVSPALLARARLLWRDRLSHLPWPRLALLLGAGAPDPEAVVSLGRQAMDAVVSRGGCVLAGVLPGCPAGAADALATGLAGGTFLLHRAGEPGPDPQLAFMGGADATLLAWPGPDTMSEACAAEGPVLLLPGVPQRTRELARLLLGRDQLRLWHGGSDPFAPWPRVPLDEAGRIAATILGRYQPLWNRSLEPDLPEQA